MVLNSKEDLLAYYNQNSSNIKRALDNFKSLDTASYFKEYLFCLLTPQSNAKKCWEAVEQLSKLNKFDEKNIIKILKTKTRFHNNKSKYILQANQSYSKIQYLLNNSDKRELRNLIAKETKGYGLKEASHFLRNIGHSNNQIAILDRHILRNLKNLNVIDTDKIKNNNHYFELENKFLEFSNQINIPIDELDLVFWSKETGEIFK